MSSGVPLISVLAGAGGLVVLVPLQAWNQRRSRFPIEVRAVLDTTLHGLVPVAALTPLWLAPAPPFVRWPLLLVPFLAGFLTDLDHVIAFRSLSMKTCSSQERRPFGHGLAFVALAGAGVWLVSGSSLLAGTAAFGIASHLFFDATDASGVPLFFPHLRIVRRIPLPFYVLFLLAGLGGATLLA